MGYKFSKTAAKQYAEQMEEIRYFCNKNNINYSNSMDSYYFTINNVDYRVSNHTEEASNNGAYDFKGEQTRSLYHTGNIDNIDFNNIREYVSITAGKTRIKEIYNDLKDGYPLNKRGNRI